MTSIEFPNYLKDDLLEITFQSVDIDWIMDNQQSYLRWLEQVIKSENGNVKGLNYMFCSDEYLLNINQTYLNHDTYTDIITFPIQDNPVISDIFISIDRVRENSKHLNESFSAELLRVMVHGLLHLIGYDDKSSDDRIIMKQKEDHYVAIF